MGESRMRVAKNDRYSVRRNFRRQSLFYLLLAVIVLCSSTALGPTESSAGPQRVVTASELPAAFLKATPSSLAELQAIENHVTSLVKQVKKATVGVQVGRAFGSGVIVSNDGYVLTAGHVSGKPNRTATITLADGRRVQAETLGRNDRADSGLMRIVGTQTDWPYAEMASAGELHRGDWCAALGHPGGVQKGREAVLRLGRVLQVGNELVRTDCELVGGDSGGPLFDMHGRVIGINSRIAERADMNFHVPVAIYKEDWDRLEGSEVITPPSNAYLGVRGHANADGDGLIVTAVIDATAAARGGLEVGDVVLRFEGNVVNSLDELKNYVGQLQPGRRVVLAVKRGDRTLTLSTRLGESE